MQMSNSKDAQNDQDPDYATPGPSDEAQQKLYEETARTNVARKITAIVEKEFSKEIESKEKEIMQIEGRLHKALKTLHFLRYVIITDFYNRKQCQGPQIPGESKQSRIHPAIKQVIGKAPRTTEISSVEREASATSKETPSESKKMSSSLETSIASSSEIDQRLGNVAHPSDNVPISLKKIGDRKRCEDSVQSTDDGPPKKIPRYVPPKSGIPEPQVPSRGARHKVRKRIIVGNISKWIPPDWREDVASHKWTMYVRGSKENADISDFVGKIRFFLHPSYRPNDVVEVTSPPFHLSRRGWGEFPVRVQLHFKNPLNKPMDVIHYLKLDRTYTGLQTLGSETVVDVWINTSSLEATCANTEKTENSRSEQIVFDVAAKIKEEPLDAEKSSDNENITLKIPDCYEFIKTEKEIKDEVSSHVYLEHDYVSFSGHKTVSLSENENNVTIAHSPPRNMTADENSSNNHDSINGDSEKTNNCARKSVLAIPSEEIVEACANGIDSTSNKNIQISNGSHEMIGDSTTLPENVDTQMMLDACNSTQRQSDSVNSANIRTSQDVKTMATNLQNSSSKLQPLKITIPVAFEALQKNPKVSSNQKKQILVMRDNKLIPVESMNLSKNTSKEIPSVVSTIVSGPVKTYLPKNNAPRNHVSLLKKSVVGNNKTMMFTLNPSNSLLLNSSNNIPALKIVEPAMLNNQKLYLVEKKVPHRTTVGILSKSKTKVKESGASGHWLDDYKLATKPKITLGKDRLGTTSKKNNYEEILRSINDVRITDVSSLVRFIIRRVPLVTEKATDPEYRNLHPYACASEKEFLNSNIGKQRALEWYRAKHIKSLLKKNGIPEESQWTIKEIMIWSRLHGYTPIRSSPNISVRTRCEKSSSDNFPIEPAETNPCTYTEPSGLLEFLRNAKENKAGREEEKKCESEIEIIDVEGIVVEGEEIGGGRKKKDTEKRALISLGIPDKIVAIQSYVCDTARQIGVKLEPEEIVPGVMHCAPARMVVKAVQCLLEDLLRSSLAKAWERSIDGRCPDSISLEDVRGAIQSREEFDLFTNEGLGSHHCPDD